MTDENDDQQQHAGGGNAEAARYRTQLREAQAQVEQLQGALLRSQQARIEALVSQHSKLAGDEFSPRLHDGGDLWALTGRTPDEFLDDEGDLDREALAGTLAQIAQDRPYLVEPYTAPAPPRDPIADAMARQGGLPPAVPSKGFEQLWKEQLKPEKSTIAEKDYARDAAKQRRA